MRRRSGLPAIRLSLRRRIFVLVMLLALVPSLLVAVLVTGYGAAAVRGYAVEQSLNRLRGYSERLGEQFSQEVAAARQIAERLSDETSPSAPPPGWLILTSRDPASAPGIPPGLASALERIGLAPARDHAGLVAVDRTQGLWVVARLHGGDGWITRPVQSNQLDTVTGLIRREREERIWPVLHPFGLLGGEEEPSELRQLLVEKPRLVDEGQGVHQLEGDSSVVYTTVRVGTFVSTAGVPRSEASLVLIQKVGLEAPTAALLYQFWQLLLGGLVFVMAVAIFAVWLSRRLVDPIVQLRDGFNRLEQGDLEFRISITSGDELEQLAGSMNRMAATLQRTYENLAGKLLELDEKARQLTITHSISQAINQSLEMDVLFRDVIDSVRQLISAERLMLGLIGDSRDRIESAYNWPESGWAFDEEGLMRLPDSLSQECLANRRVGVFPLAVTDSIPEARLLRRTSVTAVCIVPLIGASGRVGVLLLADRDPAAFGAQEVELLERLAPSLATAVEHSRLYARQEQFANELEQRVQQRTVELQKAQDQLLQVEKLAASGELAANIAHEINNPLSIIKNYMKLLHSQLLAKRTDTSNMELVRDGLSIIGEEIDRIARIVDQLRRVNAPASPQLAPVDLQRELNLIIELFRQTFYRKRIEVQAELDPSIGTVLLSSDYLRQILINLLRNAYDATDAGGTIHVRSIGNKPEPGWFSIVVRDTGIGIPPENLGKIFDPFFTTKKEGKGTGLGLAVSYGLARQMGGRIEAASPAGGGAELTVILPRRAPTAPGEEEVGVVRRQGSKIIIG